jgi:hypothetical protein
MHSDRFIVTVLLLNVLNELFPIADLAADHDHSQGSADKPNAVAK